MNEIKNENEHLSEYFKFLHSGLATISLAYFYTMIDKINIINESFWLPFATLMFLISIIGNSFFVYMHYSSTSLSLKIVCYYKKYYLYARLVDLSCRCAYFGVLFILLHFIDNIPFFSLIYNQIASLF